MGFIGSINGKLRQFFNTYAPLLDGRDCYIGCSGNFTIEQILTRRAPGARLYSNDISLYSSVLGHSLLGKDLPLQVVNDELRFAQSYIDRGGPYPVAVLSLFLTMFKYEKRNNPFNERMWQSYLVNFERLLEQTISKVERAGEQTKISAYTMVDVHEFYPRPDGVSIGFLPTYVGGYEKLFKRLDESISWPAPDYAMLTTERREATIARMAEGDYILYDDVVRDFPCVARVDLMGMKTVYIYSNLSFGKGVFRKTITETQRPYDLLMPEEEIPADAVVSIKETDLATINHYRNLYLSKKIQPGSGGPCYLVFAGGKLFGFLIFQVYSKHGGDSGEIYLLSDFVVPSKRHPRLAKLLLMVLLCQETKQTLDEKSLRRYSGVLTTAFTDKPVSMKYRGLMELAKRGEGFLNYRGEFTATTYREVIAQWTKRFNKPAKPSRA